MEEHTLQLKELKKALMGGKASDIETAVNDCLGAGIDVRVIIKSIQKDMCDVGIQFEKGRIFLPQMLAMAAGIQSAMSILRPMLEKWSPPNRRARSSRSAPFRATSMT